MALTFEDLRGRLASALADLAPPERADADRVMALLARVRAAVDAGQRASVEGAEGEPIRRELLGLIERLGRRGANAIPFASTARALSAELGGHPAVRDESLAAADEALMIRGL